MDLNKIWVESKYIFVQKSSEENWTLDSCIKKKLPAQTVCDAPLQCSLSEVTQVFVVLAAKATDQ